MRSTSEAPRRAPGRSPAGLRPIALLILSTPLLLSACATSGPGTTTTSAPSVDAYGYAPVRISAFADGSRIALPSAKPDVAKLAAAPETAKAPEAGAEPGTEIAALQADVAERKAATAPAVPETKVETTGKTARLTSAKEAPAKQDSTVSTIASAASALNPAEAVPASIAAVGGAAEAVTTAAAETGAKAYEAVSGRLGDTFKGKDTITGNAAIDRMIEAAAAENDIPSELAYAVVRVESHYNPKATGSGGVYGLSQIKPATARSLGFSGSASDLYDPETNLRYGMKYLAGAWQKSGKDICGAAMKYKGGHRTTRMSKSASAYCANVKRHMAAIERRRAPANRETIIAANERQKQIAVAAEVSGTVPGVAASPAGEKRAEAFAPVAQPVVPRVTQAASTPAGRSVAASAAPVPAAPDAGLAAPLKVASDASGRGGRVVRASAPVQGGLGFTN